MGVRRIEKSEELSEEEKKESEWIAGAVEMLHGGAAGRA